MKRDLVAGPAGKFMSSLGDSQRIWGTGHLGVSTRLFAAKETNHSKLNDDLGVPDDPATKALFEFVDEQRARQ